jgi:hypothetical protein
MKFPHRNILILPNIHSMHNLKKFKPPVILINRNSPPEGKLQIRAIPGLINSKMGLIDNCKKIPKQNSKATITKPNITPEPDLSSITQLPSITHLSSLSCLHNTLPKRRADTRSGHQNVGG